MKTVHRKVRKGELKWRKKKVNCQKKLENTNVGQPFRVAYVEYGH